MPQTVHIEKHFTASETVRDIVIGMSDGLTVPFALAAGLSAVATSGVVVTAGFAEIAAGSIAMGLGGYLAARSDAEHYASELAREYDEIETKTDFEIRETEEILVSYGLTVQESQPVIKALQKRPKDWVGFMMRFELGLEEPHPGRARNSALTIALSYIGGGLIPLSPYIFMHVASEALPVSIIVTLLALGIFGYIKGRFTGSHPVRAAFQTMLIGGLAAGAAFLIAKWIG